MEDADGLVVLNRVPNVFGGEDVLDDLVFVHTAPGLFDGVLGDRHVLVQGSEGRLVHDVIDLLLCEVAELFERGRALVCESVDHRLRVRIGRSFGVCHERVHPFLRVE